LICNVIQEDDAVVFDRANGVFAIPEKVHNINHHGKYFNVPGAHLCEPSIQRTPVIFQAGASKAGINFASQHAEAMFLIAPTADICKQQVQKIRNAIENQGRDPYSVKIFALLTIITGATDHDAQEKLADYQQYTTLEGSLALYGGWVGVNLPLFCTSSSSSLNDSQSANSGVIDGNTPLQHIANDNIHSLMDQWSRIPSPDGQPWTVKKIAEYISMGGAGPTICGSGESIADQMEEWIRVGDIDGFNLAYVITPGTFQDIVNYVVPVLRRRGRLPSSVDHDTKTTLRERLGGSSARLAHHHIAASYRDKFKKPTQSPMNINTERLQCIKPSRTAQQEEVGVSF
jgi:alkanesulfonate monooxygenase SsuD/methylene tetrahydromethanopterin reductase-like flavin-dependent oxidoreductase (luciferase family)